MQLKNKIGKLGKATRTAVTKAKPYIEKAGKGLDNTRKDAAAYGERVSTNTLNSSLLSGNWTSPNQNQDQKRRKNKRNNRSAQTVIIINNSSSGRKKKKRRSQPRQRFSLL